MQYPIQSSWINQKEFVTKTSLVVIFFACGKGKVSVKLAWMLVWLESLLLSYFLPGVAPGGGCCLKNSVNNPIIYS